MTAFTVPRAAIRHPMAAGVLHLAQWLAGAAVALGRIGLQLDGWFAAQAKARDDSTALQAMSERELRDIGLDPARVGLQPAAWNRDWPV